MAISINALRLSNLFKNATVKAAFERAERDNGAALVVAAPKPPHFIGGAGASLQWRRNLETLELA